MKTNFSSLIHFIIRLDQNVRFKKNKNKFFIIYKMSEDDFKNCYI